MRLLEADEKLYKKYEEMIYKIKTKKNYNPRKEWFLFALK